MRELVVLGYVTLFSAEEGGKQKSITGNTYRCLARIGRAYHDCALFTEGKTPISPGDKVTLDVTFLFPETVPALDVGDRFELWEMRPFARVEVVAIKRR